MREVQRNYKKIFEQARITKKPVILGVRGKPQVVVMGMKTFERIREASQEKKQAHTWEQTKKELEYFARQGRQDINLAQFVREDRQRH